MNKVLLAILNTKDDDKEIGIILIASIILILFLSLFNRNFLFNNIEDENLLQDYIILNREIILEESDYFFPLDKKFTVISSPFSKRINPITNEKEHHLGIDLVAPAGTYVYASKSGICKISNNDINSIFYHTYDKSYGNLIVIKEIDNASETRYAHLSEILVDNNQYVEQGEIIGKVGSTGYSTAPHLHFEIRFNNIAVDPKDFIFEK